jgi:hypothetical protein
MAKPAKNTLVEHRADPAARLVPVGAGSLLLLIAGIALFFFGINLSSDPSVAASVAEYIKSLSPSPAMLQKLDYKLEALASIAKTAGVVTAVISFVVFYLTLKGISVFSWVAGKIKSFVRNIGDREGAKNLCFIIGSAILVMPASILVLFASSAHFFGQPVSAHHFLVACALTVTYVWLAARFFFRQISLQIFFFVVSAFILLISFSQFAASGFYDTAFDSLAYHQENIIRLSEGWTPFSLEKGTMTDEFIASHVYTHAKASAILASSFYKISGDIESGKLFNFLLIFASFFLCFSAVMLLPWIRLRSGLLVAGLMAFNPVSIYQSASYYVDGQLSSMMVCLLSIALMIMLERRKMLHVFLFGVSVVITINLKLTGVVYSFVVSAGMSLYLLFREKFRLFVAASTVFLAAGLIGVFFVGFNPYVTNHIYHGHLFYPFFCDNAIPVIDHGPPSIKGKSQAEKAFVSVFSESENFYVGRLSEYKFKFPLRVSARELVCFANTDTRIGGMGPLFGAMAVISFLIILAGFFYDWKQSLWFMLFYLWIVFSALIITEPWWMRFVPQLWIAAVSPAVMACKYRAGLLMYLGRTLLFLAVLNILLISGVYFPAQLMTTASLNRQLSEIASKYEKIYIYFPFNAKASMFRLKKAGIAAEAVREDYFKASPEVLAADFYFGYYTGERK